ncbi:Radical SAM superfamily protein [Tistlia consotensis]|uniref:Radical SAM superfamily protein n=1 Tax=Tistlia consotensis USBA 355 TaxID=560819 RepID=A0A1Y6BMV3_9PROT|nr:radical SAM protein [Tistlia consotensis]SMF15958.1 Radical SAM superfamily protein [Tistlia consotensis USBA 355]SNR41549.1 Radical SAM superfamily protein [Tistlia consotensis]
MSQRRFRIALVKPSHYDDDGYVIQWLKSFIPSNSLASVHALMLEARDRRVLGPEVEIEIRVQDETNTVIDPAGLAAWLKEAEAGGFLGLVGVQSNQFPRALDIARPLRTAGVPVAIGGFHVSGCLAMLPELPPDIREARELGCILYAGEAEGRMDAFIKAMADGTAEPLYDYMKDLPDMEAATVPFLPPEVVRRNAGSYASFDAGRGCPFQCSFCTIINVQGRKSRFRTADDIERIIRENAKQGIRRFFITDDNFARNRNWEAILDRCIRLREVEGMNFKFIIQVDTLCHKTPGFIEKAVRAGAHRVFIGLENVNPDNLAAAKKRQNKIWEYRAMLQEWKRHGAMTYAGYILGFPGDTPEKIRTDLEIIQRELPLDLVEFFILTPLPGSEDHQTLTRQGAWMDPDMNRYDVEHVVSRHPRMSAVEWQGIYNDAWRLFYTPAHVETILRRGAANGLPMDKLLLPLVWFSGFVPIEKVHPLQGGWFRRKVRTQRRPGLPIESRLAFYPRRAWEVTSRHLRWIALYLAYERIRRRIRREGSYDAYRDTALMPTDQEALAELQLMQVHGDHIVKTYGSPETRKHREPEVAAE